MTEPLARPREPVLLLLLAGVAAAAANGACRNQPLAPAVARADATAGSSDSSRPSAPDASARATKPPAENEGDGEGHTKEELAAAKRYQRLLCVRRTCCATAIWPAGKDRRGRDLTVVEVGTDDACIIQEPEPTSTGDQDQDETNDEDDGPTHPCHDYWLMIEPKAKGGKAGRPQKRSLVAQQCDADKWEGGASVEAKDQTFHYGGHSLFENNKTDNATVIGLDPLRLVERQEGSMSLEHSRDQTWSFDQFSGYVDFGVDYCTGKAPPDAGVSSDRDSPPVEIRSVTIPRIALPESFRASGWRTIGLGRCAALIDGGDGGFTIHGAKSTPADSTMRLLLSSANELFVEIDDDRLVSGARSWVKDDHLELWAAPEESCIDPGAKSAAVQWGIRVLDGKVFPGFGSPPSTPAVEVQRNGRTVRLKIGLPDATLRGRFTVVYSDSDDGVRQKRLIATSELEFGKWWTLGDVAWFGLDTLDPADACAVGARTLEPKRVPYEGG